MLLLCFLARRVAARKIKGATLRSWSGLSFANRHFRPAFQLRDRTNYISHQLFNTCLQLILPASLLSYQLGTQLLIRPAPQIEPSTTNYTP